MYQIAYTMIGAPTALSLSLGRANMRQVGIQRNRQAQVETLVQLLLEPVGRRQRQKLIALLDSVVYRESRQ